MTADSKDVVEVKSFSDAKEEMRLHFRGGDRPGIIAAVTAQLEACRLYVDSMVFNLLLPMDNEYEMEILAKGDLRDLRTARSLVESAQFLPAAPQDGKLRIHWPEASMFHVALMTPDRRGLIAKISGIVGKHRGRPASNVCTNGSFVHLIGVTHNSGGPQGGTAYFNLRANVATQSLDVQREIMLHLAEWAKKNDIKNDLWVQDLNHPA